MLDWGVLVVDGDVFSRAEFYVLVVKALFFLARWRCFFSLSEAASGCAPDRAGLLAFAFGFSLHEAAAGISPRRATFFLCFAKERRQRKATRR
jgi:hypothetical protein